MSEITNTGDTLDSCMGIGMMVMALDFMMDNAVIVGIATASTVVPRQW